MKKNKITGGEYFPGLRKILMIMKLIMVLILFSITQVNAGQVNSVASKLTLNVKNSSIEKILFQIEEKTEYKFVYNKDIIDVSKIVNIDVSKIVNIDVKDQDIYTVLNKLLEGQKVKFQTINNNIIISPVYEFPQQQKNITVTGKVIEKNGDPIAGADVYEKNNPTHGVITAADGSYSISVDNSDVILVYSFIGYKPQEIHVAGRKTINVTLMESAIALDEVVFIGYGTSRKQDLTGAAAQIDEKDLKEKSIMNPIAALVGKVPGLQIMNNSGQPNGRIQVSIRGYGSINASNSPLWVVDGIEGYDPNLLNQNDIESVSVLKDASASAIYGSRGANGVIIITTKRAKAGKTNVELDYSFGLSHISKIIEMANASESVEIYKRYYEYEGIPWPDLHKTYPKVFGTDQKPLYDVNWQKLTTRIAPTHKVNLSITGGSDKAKTGLFVSYVSNEGILLETDAKKFNARLTNDLNLTSWLEVNSQLSFNHIGTSTFGGNAEVTRMMLEYSPMIPYEYPDGTHGNLGDSYAGWNPMNPIDQLKAQKLRNWSSNITLSMTVNVQITKGLKFSTVTAGTYSPSYYKHFTPGKPYFDDGWSNPQGNAWYSNGRGYYFQSENYFNYNKSIGSHNFIGMVGLSWNRHISDGFNASNRKFSDPNLGFYNIGLGETKSVPAPSSWYSESKINSYFARLTYNFNDKYYLTATGRYDGSSRFGANYRYAFFPSFAIAWRISNEGFLKDNKLISNLKLRFSYGKTGNSAIGNYSTFSLVNQGRTLLDNRSLVNFAVPGNPSNANLRWETTGQTNIGLDLSMFNGKISFVGDYFIKNTENLLFHKPTSIVSGFSSVLTNIGNVQNKGVELQLGFNQIVLTKDFSWSGSINYYMFRNEVKKLGLNDEDIFMNSFIGGAAQVIRVGESLGSYYLYKRLGIWGTDEADEAAKYGQRPGMPKRLDVNNDGKINEADKMIVGHAFPKYEMMFSNTFSYKNLSLSFDIRFVHGNSNLFYNIVTQEDRAIFGNSLRTLYTDGWTPTHQNTMVVAAKGAWDGKIDSYYLEDGSFIRGQNFNLSYELNRSFVKRLGLGQVNIYASAINFFLITKYRGWDPEVNNRGNVFGQGMEFNAWPKSTTYSIGINVKF